MTGKTHKYLKKIRNIETNFTILKHFEVGEITNIDMSST